MGKEEKEASCLSKPKLIQQQEQDNSVVLGWRKDALGSSHSRHKLTYKPKMPELCLTKWKCTKTTVFTLSQLLTTNKEKM